MLIRRCFLVTVLLVSSLVTLCGATTTLAQGTFELVGELPISGNWVNRADSGWLISNVYSWSRTDEQFDVVAYGGPSPEMRGIDWDPTRNLVFYSEPFVRDIVYATSDGAIVGRFESTDFVNGLSVNPVTGDIWLASFGGLVERVDGLGNVLQSFIAPFTLTGVAVDPIRNSLYLMRAHGSAGVGGEFDDEIYEFSYDGVNLGLIIPAGSFNPNVIGNGIGLEFVPETGLLYASGLSRTQVFQRVPEPSTFLLLAISGALIGRHLRRVLSAPSY